jgi:TP901 family phage tail tape measure protein
MAEVKDVTIRINVDDGDVKNTKKDFDSLNKSVTDGSKQMTGSLNTMSGSLLKVGAALGGAFAFKAVIGDAVKRIREFDQSMANLGAITGKTGKELEEFQKGVLQVSKNTGKGAADVAKAFQIVGSATPELLKSAEALGAVTEQAIILSKAGGLEVPEAADALTKAMNQFGASAEDAALFTDILATSQQKGTATIAQLSESLKNVGAVANAAGLSFEETNVALQSLAKGGLTGAEAGTGLRGVLTKLSAQADSSINPSMTSLTDVIENLSKKNLDLKSATELVGLESAKTLLTLTSQKDVINTLTGELNEVGNASEQAAQRFETIDGQLEKLDSSYERFILSLEDGDGVISQVGSSLIGTFDDLLNSFTELNNFDFNSLFGAESFVAADKAAFDLSATMFDLIGTWTVGADKMGDSIRQMGEEATKSTTSVDESFSRLSSSMLANKDTAQTIVNTYIKLGFSANEARDKYIDLVKAQTKSTEATMGNTEALEEDTQATNDNTKSKEKQLDFFDKLALKIKETKEAIEKEDILGTIFDDSFDEEEDPAFLKAVGLDDEGLEKMKEGQEKKRELVAENASLELEEDLLRQEAQLEQDQLFAQAKQDINEQLGFSALALAGAIASAAGDSQAAQAAALAFDKIAAIASIIINTQRANALISATIPAPASLPLIAKNNISGALGVATVVATAIPQAKAITESKKLKDGEIRIQGAGTTTSDSIPAMLSREESVINAKSSIKHEGALKAINDDRFDDYLNKVLIKQLYMGKVKENKASKKALQNSINFPKAFRMSNAKEISKDIAKVMDEHNFLNQNGKWE